MALAEYREKFWYPDGTLAANETASVFPLRDNTFTPLYTDATGTTALPNPLQTDAQGFLTFWAEEGEYWIHVARLAFRVAVGSPRDLNLFETGITNISTGILRGGVITANALDPQAFDISETVGYVVDHTTDPANPTFTRVEVPAQTVSLTPDSLARLITYVLMDTDGNVMQQGTRPGGSQLYTHLTLGAFGWDQLTGELHDIAPYQTILDQPAAQFAQFTNALGPFNVFGNRISPNGVNLMFNKASGEMFSRSFNAWTNPQEPNRVDAPAEAPATFRRGTQMVGSFGNLVTTIDPANYDVAGVITPVPGGTNVSTIQRVWLLPSGNTTSQLAVQYGQATYSTLDNARNAVGGGTFVANPVLERLATLVGYICVIRTATNLSDPAQARFVHAGKFATP